MKSDGQGEPQATIARWEFVRMPDSGADIWIWRRICVDGTVETSAEIKEGIGKAMIDAVRNGFNSREHSWTVYEPGWSTHFEPGAAPRTTGRGDPPTTITGAQPKSRP